MKKSLFVFGLLFNFAYADPSSYLENIEFLASNLSMCDYKVETHSAGIAYKEYDVTFECGSCRDLKDCDTLEKYLKEMMSFADLIANSSRPSIRQYVRQIKEAAGKALNSVPENRQKILDQNKLENQKKAEVAAVAAKTASEAEDFGEDYSKKYGIDLIWNKYVTDNLEMTTKFMEALKSPRIIELLQNSAVEKLLLLPRVYEVADEWIPGVGILPTDRNQLALDVHDVEDERKFTWKLARLPSRKSLTELRAMLVRIKDKIQGWTVHCGFKTSLTDCTLGAQHIIKVIDKLEPKPNKNIAIRSGEQRFYDSSKTEPFCSYDEYSVKINIKAPFSDDSLVSCLNSFEK